MKLAAYGHLFARKLEPPGPDRFRRLLDTAVARRKQRLVSDTAAQLSSPTRTALDALVKTGASESDPINCRCFLSVLNWPPSRMAPAP